MVHYYYIMINIGLFGIICIIMLYMAGDVNIHIYVSDYIYMYVTNMYYVAI